MRKIMKKIKDLSKLKSKLKLINPLQKAKMYDSLEMPKKVSDTESFTLEEQETNYLII
jgi:hypothetical protein